MEPERGSGATGRAGGVEDAEVLVVGGGMVGLSLAAALAGAGVETAAVDREAPSVVLDPGFDGRASAIAYGTRRILEGIGLWPHLAHSAEAIREIRVADGGSPLVLHYDHRALGEEPLGHMVENRVLRAGLARLAAERPRLRLHAPAALEHLERGAGRVEARLADGTRIRARLAVAADGRESALREAAGIPARRWTYPQTGIVATVGHDRPHRGVAIEHFLPAGPFAILPLGPDGAEAHRSSIVWTERAAVAPAMTALPPARFAAELARRFGDHWGAVRPLGRPFSHPLGGLWAARITDRRLALVGDAAHAIHPIAGQGLNLGLRDVAALAEAVVDARRLGLDVGDATTLERYAGWRGLDTLALVAVTDGLNRLFSNSLPPLALARRLGLAAVDRMPALKRYFMRHAMGTLGRLPRLARGEAL